MKSLIGNLVNVSSKFQQVLTEMKKNKSVESFENELNEVVEVLEKAVDSQRRLLNQIQELNAKVSISEANLLDMNSKCIEKEKARESMKQDLVKACTCIENLRESENQYREKILMLEEQILTLETEKNDAVPEKEKAFEIEAERERKLLNSRILQLESDLKIKEETEVEIKSKLMETVQAMQKLEENVEILRLKLKEELERSLTVVKDRHVAETEVRGKEDRLQELEELVHSLKQKLEGTVKKINSYELKVSAHQKKINSLRVLYQKTKEEAIIQIDSLRQISSEKDKLTMLLERKDADLKTLNGKLVNVINEKEVLLQKLLNIQNQKQDADISNNHLKNELMTSEREIMKLKKQQAQHESEVSTLIREKELLAGNIIKMENIMEKYSDQCKVSENERITLYQDLKKSELQIEKQNKVIATVEGMKTQLLNDIKSLTKKIEKLNNDIICHEEKEVELQAKLMEVTNKFSQQIDISSGAILDRTIFCKQYKEIKENNDQMKRKMDILESYVNELNSSQQSHEQEIEDWKRKWEALDLKNKTLMTKLAQEESTNFALKAQCKHFEEQTRSQLQTIQNKEKELELHQSKLLHTTEECMMVRSQLQQQKKLITRLEEKLNHSESIIIKEQELYSTLENTTKLLHLEILRLTGEKNSLMCKVNDLQKLKESFMHAKEELHKERYKNSALELEMQRPLNVHRWRLLKGTDPEKYELIENYNMSQKQLLKKCVEIEKKEKKLSNVNKLVDQLKNIVSRQKDVEHNQVKIVNQNQVLKEKNDKIKALSFEVNMNETYMSSYQAEIARLKEELKKMKLKQFFKDKHKVLPLSTNAFDSESQI